MIVAAEDANEQSARLVNRRLSLCLMLSPVCFATADFDLMHRNNAIIQHCTTTDAILICAIQRKAACGGERKRASNTDDGQVNSAAARRALIE